MSTTNFRSPARAAVGPEPTSLHSAPSSASHAWSPRSWESCPAEQQIAYDDPDEVKAVVGRLGTLPPLVTSFEIENLNRRLPTLRSGSASSSKGATARRRWSTAGPTSSPTS